MRKTLKNKIRGKKPKFSDEVQLGPEPALKGKDFNPTDLNIVEALNWYNYFYTVKDARGWVNTYMKQQGYADKDIRLFDTVDTNDIPLAVCSVSRMLSSGCSLPGSMVENNRAKIDSLLKKVKEERSVKAIARVSVPQSTLIADVENILDSFYNKNYKPFEPEITKLLQQSAAKPAEAKALVDYYKPLLDELKEKPEGYGRLSKKQHKDYVAFVEKIIQEATQYVRNQKNAVAIVKERKPRKKKVKTVDQLVKNIKYKVSDKDLNVTSIPPTSIIGASTLWLYNTKYKKLMVVYAEEGKTLSLKGTTLINFDTEKSEGKTLRKPAETISQLLNSGKAGMRQVFKGLKTKGNAVNGRINQETLLLKAYK